MSNEIYQLIMDRLGLDDIELTGLITAASLSELLYELNDDNSFVSECFPDRSLEEVEDACCLLIEYFGVYGKDYGDEG